MKDERALVLEVEGLDVTFRRRRGPLTKPAPVRAVRDVGLKVRAGQTVGLVGESGSGKTTTARAILGLVPASAGTIRAGGFEPTAFGTKVPKGYRRVVQAVFQDPFGSLNPSMVVADIVAEPIDLHFDLNGTERRARIQELLASVGLAEHHAQRYPYELSGGQRQRVAIARAISVEPELIVLDEPVSALDVSVQSQVVNLLEDLQERTGVAYLFVAHDLAVVRHASDRIVVMYHSRIVEEGPADRICDAPEHPYTKALLAAVPVPDPERQAVQRALRRSLSVTTGEAPPAEGCPFAPRCPLRMDVCDSVFPPWTPLTTGGGIACHAVGESTTGTPVQLSQIR